ncbi:hypothetical protein [Oceanobacillus kimchii]|uniref:hypothetical protein n=1 Tax=Oceanobacillus kimchii TaxID=746691 RepID=UPI00232B7BFA|nr:hypothetical protein [Oceanobacillus kimchii]
MKKKLLILTFAFFAIFFFGFDKDEADAATHSWQKFPKAGSTCEVRAWTDYLTYTKRATSVDFYLESRGNCGRLDYFGTPTILKGGNYDISPGASGYFSFKTPVKRAILNKDFVRPSSGELLVNLSKNGRNVGVYSSKKLSYPNR